MGLSHAVFLVQVLHEWILRRVDSMKKAAVPREWGLRPASACLRMLAGVIVDDLYIVGLESKEEVGRYIGSLAERTRCTRCSGLLPWACPMPCSWYRCCTSGSCEGSIR